MFWPFQPPALPTSQLYGLAGNYDRVRGSCCRMGAAFRLGSQTVVVRCGLPIASNQPFHVLIDDDIEAAIVDPDLPEEYRRRLREAWDRSAIQLDFDRIRSVIVPSERLANLYQTKGKPVIHLDPSWPVAADHPGLDFNADRFQVAFLGTRSHVADLDLLHEALLDPARDWEFHHFLGEAVPPWLLEARLVVAHKPMAWSSYFRIIGKLRFHLCVYPMRETAVNGARSCNKIMEHAMTGAAALYSRNVPFAESLRHVSADLLVPDDGWREAIRQFAENRSHCMDLAWKSHRLALDIAAAARSRQEQLWSSVSRDDLNEWL